MDIIYFQPKGIRPQYCEAGIIHESDPEYIWYLDEPCKTLINEVKIIPKENVTYDKKSRSYLVHQSCLRFTNKNSGDMKKQKIQIGYYIYWAKNLASMLYSKLLRLFGVRLSTSVIPEGPYCYTPDYEKNKIAESFTYYVIPCKYYKTLGKRWNGCKYLGIITDDFVFDDQCKMCGENYGDEDE